MIWMFVLTKSYILLDISLAMLKFFPKFVLKCTVCSDSDLGTMLAEISLKKMKPPSWQLKIIINGYR